MRGQRTGRRAHDGGTLRGLGCLQTSKEAAKTMYRSTNSEGGSIKMNAEGQIGRGGVEGVSAVEGTPSQSEQYSLAKILGIWAAAALPMGALAWVVAPLVAGGLDGPVPLIRTLLALLTVGLIWQFVLLLVHRERGSLRWPVLKDALWLQAPR